MKKYIFNSLLIITGFIILSCCILEIFGFFDIPKTVTCTFDASKDTSFLVKRHGRGPAVILNIDGYLNDTALVTVSNYIEDYKYDKNSGESIKLYPSKVHKKDLRPDFYRAQAIIHYWHLNNKKGRLKVSASL